ncbi:MAG: NAD(P)/FAD-dependent oxidoreductase [Planctomycetes bacterium]|nr:NAD(P)/FAD-dependent oxidoreductase [Planctomycetota bacterium]
MNKPDEKSYKKQSNPSGRSEKKSSEKSRRYYKSSSPKEPWYLKLIFWTLVTILVVGGGFAGFVMINKLNLNQEARTIEIEIDELIVNFQDKIYLESDKIIDKEFEDARKLAFEGKEISDKIAHLIEVYLKKYDENIEGFIRFVEHKEKYESLYKKFIELNKDDPRYHKDNIQTMPNNENSR